MGEGLWPKKNQGRALKGTGSQGFDLRSLPSKIVTMKCDWSGPKKLRKWMEVAIDLSGFEDNETDYQRSFPLLTVSVKLFV